MNACNTEALQENLPFCINNQIQYYSSSPLNMGLLGNCYDSFTLEPPVWLDTLLVESAKCAKCLADLNEITLPELAHRFLLSLPYTFNIVIGASNLEELSATLQGLRRGPLPVSLVREILKCANGKLSDEQD